LDPVIGRDDEIRRTIQILQRRTKNNPVLFANRVWARPPSRRPGAAHRQRARCRDAENKRILMLDLALLLAGAKYRGEFEERLKTVLKELSADEGKTIVFIDEIHTMVGPARPKVRLTRHMLKPAWLARMHCIGATRWTISQADRKGPALERRFRKCWWMSRASKARSPSARPQEAL